MTEAQPRDITTPASTEAEALSLVAKSDLSNEWKQYLGISVADGFMQYAGDRDTRVTGDHFTNEDRRAFIEDGLTFIHNRSIVWMEAQPGHHIAILPRKTVLIQSRQYAQKWLTEPEAHQGKVYTERLLAHQETMSTLVDRYEMKFPELHFSKLLKEELQHKGHAAAANTVEEIVTIYGQVLALFNKTPVLGRNALNGTMNS